MIAEASTELRGFHGKNSVISAERRETKKNTMMSNRKENGRVEHNEDRTTLPNMLVSKG